MSFSSFKKSKLIFENWRRFINEAPLGSIGGIGDEPEEEEEAQAAPAKKAPAEEASSMQKVADKLADTGTPLSQYVAILKKYAADPEFRALATAGHTDVGGPEDEQVSVKRRSTAAKNLTATQAEIGFDNSLKDQMTNPPYSPPPVNAALGLAGEPGSPIIMPSQDDPPPPILVWNDEFILDGHHRWSQVMMTNPDGIVAVDNVTGPAIDNEEEALKAMQLAIAGAAGNVVTKPFKGANLMDASPEQVYDYVLKNITDEVLQLLAQAEKIAKPDKQLAAKYFAGNLGVIKNNKGRFSREASMPQAGKSGTSQDTVNKLLGTGKVNFEAPSTSDVKKAAE
jgi:hypothetical protein